MVAASGPETPGDGGQGQRKRRAKGRKVTPNPVGNSPWGDPGWDPSPAEQAVLQSFGPAAQAVTEFVAAINHSIIESLASAEQSVNAVATAAKLDLTSSLTPASAAVARVRTDATTAIRQQLATAAEYTSAGTGQAALLSDAAGWPVPPTPKVFTSPDVPTVPRSVPPNIPGAPVPNAPTAPPPQQPPYYNPNPPPGSIPPREGTTPIGPRPWGQTNAAGPVAATTGAPSGAPATVGLPKVDDVCPLPAPPPDGLIWCLLPYSAFPDGAPDKSTGAYEVRGKGYLYPTNEATCNLSHGTVITCPDQTMGGGTGVTPTPTSPTTPTPTSPTTPTPTSPTPTSPTTTPTPKPPPIGSPPPPTCPPGSNAVWVPSASGSMTGSWICQQAPTPPQQPGPINITVEVPPEPPPTVNITDTTSGGTSCGMTRDNPCWDASNPPDGKRHPFLTTPGTAWGLFRQQTANLSLPEKLGAPLGVMMAIGGNPDDIVNCDTPYMVSIVDPGTGIGEMLAKSMDFKTFINLSMGDKNALERVTSWSILAPLWMAIELGVKTFGALADAALGAVKGANETLASIAASEMTFGVLNLMTLGALRKHKQILEYSNNTRFPVGLPSPETAAGAWLGNEIDECTFQAYCQAGDMRFTPFKQVARAGKLKLTALDLVTLDRRGKLVRGDLPSRLREQGSLHPEDQAELNSLFEQIPGPSEIVRYMVRDVANQQVIQTFQLNTGFTDNYNGQLKKWGEQQGLTELQMSYEWMSHWSIPSPTQLYEMLHRLRHKPEYGGVDKVTSDVVTALKQQDILPYWIPRLMAVSYHAITRTDMNRAYDRGWIDDQTYLNGMYDNGYSDDGAKQLLRFAKSERKVAIHSLEEVKLFANGYISQDQLQEAVSRLDWGDAVWPDILAEAQFQRTIYVQRRVMDSIARQYKACRITLREAHDAAEAFDVPLEEMDILLEVAYENTVCGTRKEYAATTGKAFEEGLLDEDQYYQRMKELKFDQEAIDIYMGLLSAKKKAAAKKAQAKAEAEAKKAELQSERQQAALARQAERQAMRIARLQQQQIRQREQIADTLMAAANELGHQLADVSGPPSALVQGLFSILQSERGLTAREASYIIKAAAGKAKGMKSPEFEQWVMADALAASAEPWSIEPPAQPPPDPLPR